MNAPVDISNEEVQSGLELARDLRAQTWTSWATEGTKALTRFARVPVALAIEVIEATRRGRRRQATVRALSALPDHILKDIGLSRDSICSVAIKLSASPRSTRPGIVSEAGTQDATKNSLAA